MICDANGLHCTEAVPAVSITHGIPVGPMWLYLLAIGILALSLLSGLLRAASKRQPHDTPRVVERKVYRCAQRGCPGRATRIVLMIMAATESRVVCDEDAARLVRLGHAVDLGPIERPRR